MDADGGVLETVKGSMRLPDVSAEALNDLEVEFESKMRGSDLSEAMRKEGVACVKKAVIDSITQMQAEVTG